MSGADRWQTDGGDQVIRLTLLALRPFVFFGTGEVTVHHSVSVDVLFI